MVRSPADKTGSARGSDSQERFGTYRLESLLGRGGMGEVYLAWDERLERHVALKRVLPDPPPDERTRARFRREARAVARLSHPAIVQVFDLLETDEGDCLVMEHVEGRSLVEHLAEGPLEVDAALRLAREIAEGLAEAHGKGLIHRDLKPENVRVTRSGHAKILDFGLARLLWQDGKSEEEVASALTQSGALVGTVHAMSPEQASGRPVDHRSDLFALGGLLYEMLGGQAPFRGINVLDTLRRVTSEEAVPLAELRPDLPDPLVRLVDQLLAKEPNQRPQNAQLVIRALEALVGGSVAVEGRAGENLSETLDRPAVRRPSRSPRERPGQDVADLPTGELVLPEPGTATLETVVRTLVVAERLEVDKFSTPSDAQAAELRARHDRIARDLLARQGGLEIEAGDRLLALFERPLAAVAFGLGYHQRLIDLSNEQAVEIEAGIAIHLGEVVLRHNPPEDVSRGARPIEVEGQARGLVRRLGRLATGRQTLLTQGVFDLARRGADEETGWDEALRWRAHGAYLLEGVDEPVALFEVGLADFAPLAPPADSDTARRAVSPSDELVLGWRPAPEQEIPRRPNWVLGRRLGAGGFGEVWLARHKSGEQRVFKFCFEASRLRALQREVTLFRLLKEALGHRDDIARILDWNFETAPYFLEVEHTEGGDLLAWSEAQGGLAEVPLDTRIDLVAQVADALAAAHSVGVLHKDVKPENVLVAPDPVGRPRIRLTDFGIGRVDPSVLEAQGVTALGWTGTLTDSDSTAGTRRYLAPELLEGKAATVQADVFSLGVLLYQAVVADFSRVLAPGWQRDVADELLRGDIAELVDGEPERRPRDVAEVARRLRGLDDRRRELAAEQRRLEEVEAADRALEQAQRRRRWASWAAVAIFVLLLGVLAVAERERRGRRAVEAAQQKTLARQQQAEGLIRFMLGDLREKLEPLGRLEVLDDVGEQALAYFETVPREELSADELASYAKALHQIGEVAHQQGDLDAALGAFEQALAMAEGLAHRDPGNEDWQQGLGEAHYWVGFVHWRRGQLDAALERFEAYLAIAKELAGRHPDDPDLQLELIYGHSNIASVLERKGDLEGALERFRIGLAIGEVMVARDPENTDYQFELAITHNAIGSVLKGLRRLDEATEHHRRELAIKRDLVAADPDNQGFREALAIVHNFLGELLDIAGDIRQGLHHLERSDEILMALVALDPANLKLQNFLFNNRSRLGIALQRAGDLGAAQETYRSAVVGHEEVVAADPSDTLWQTSLAASLIDLGWNQQLLGERDAGYESAQRALSILEGPALGDADSSPPTENLRRRILATVLLGQLEADRGAVDRGRELWGEALRDLETLGDSSDWMLAEVRVHALEGLGRSEEAELLLGDWVASGYPLRRFRN